MLYDKVLYNTMLHNTVFPNQELDFRFGIPFALISVFWPLFISSQNQIKSLENQNLIIHIWAPKDQKFAAESYLSI